MGRFGAVLIAALVGAAVCAIAFATGGFGPWASRGGVATAPAPVGPSVSYPGDGVKESKLVAAEDQRILQARTVSTAAELTGIAGHQPYRLAIGSGYTLVLPERDKPYTIPELTSIAPRTFTAQPDGSLVLNENIVVQQGATLQMTGSRKLLMLSSSDRFVSIVTVGGSLEIQGTKDKPFQVQSFDPATGSVDSATADGRAYIRVMGGYADLVWVDIDSLGFWSGVTGGLSLTGTTVPKVQSTELTPQVTGDPAGGPPTLFGTQLMQVGGGTVAGTGDPALAELGNVSARIRGVQIRGNAYGVFVSGASGVQISDSSVSRSLVDGIVFHRNVTDSSITSTQVDNSGGDGIAVLRATGKVTVSRVTSRDNALNGITLDGSPIADGPSPAGFSTVDYGGNSLTRSAASGNGHYGVEVSGGTGIVVTSNVVSGQSMGIVIDSGAKRVTVRNNVVKNARLQGIALRDAGTDTRVVANTIDGGAVGIYARNAGGVFDRNVVRRVTNHGITLVGSTGASVVSKNAITGSGPSALDTGRSTTEVRVASNRTASWRSTKPLDVVLRSIFQPLTVMWIALGVLVVGTAVAGLGRRSGAIRDPYPEHVPLASYGRGIITVDAARELESQRTQAARIPAGPALPTLPALHDEPSTSVGSAA